MKDHILYLLFIMHIFTSLQTISAQSIPADCLIEKRSIHNTPVYYNFHSRNKYSGHISGYVLPRLSDMGCASWIASYLENYRFSIGDSLQCNYMDNPIFVEGNMYKGREQGLWKVYDMYKNQLSEVRFSDSDTILVHISYKGKTIFEGGIEAKKRRHKNKPREHHYFLLKA